MAMSEPTYFGDVELEWRGDGTRYVPGVPARDLDAADLDRLVYVQSAGTLEGTSDGLRRGGSGFDEARASLITSLTRDGLYAAPAGGGGTTAQPAAAPDAAPDVEPAPDYGNTLTNG